MIQTIVYFQRPTAIMLISVNNPDALTGLQNVKPTDCKSFDARMLATYVRPAEPAEAVIEGLATNAFANSKYWIPV